jgi:SAM-dependent methyltransferase
MTGFRSARTDPHVIELVDDMRIRAAMHSLDPLGAVDLLGRSFLDVGCGSGLFSLAAHRLGARVHSFDADPDSVAATTELRRRFAPDSDWEIEQGSTLDESFLERLDTFNVVYSWALCTILATFGVQCTRRPTWSSRVGSSSSRFITIKGFEAGYGGM